MYKDSFFFLSMAYFPLFFPLCFASFLFISKAQGSFVGEDRWTTGVGVRRASGGFYTSSSSSSSSSSYPDAFRRRLPCTQRDTPRKSKSRAKIPLHPACATAASSRAPLYTTVTSILYNIVGTIPTGI